MSLIKERVSSMEIERLSNISCVNFNAICVSDSGRNLLFVMPSGVSAGNPYRFIDEDVSKGGNWTWPHNTMSSRYDVFREASTFRFFDLVFFFLLLF